ncbi:MAG: DUF4301 domain-containing protein [Bacteroidetes bacterium]|nr:MAG: DUF4301 domain-containing protein [Bacteroidota bacterium]
MFTDKDLQLFAKKGIDKGLIDSQIENFQNGFPFVNLTAAATPDKGLLCFSETVVHEYVAYFDLNAGDYDVLKFVPASGAASRMFKDLFEFRDALQDGFDFENVIENPAFKTAKYFFDNIERFSFYNALNQAVKKDGYSLIELIELKNYGRVLDYVLGEKGLNYSKLPKGLILFHKYEDANRLAMEEHLVEGANYAKSGNGEVKIHFTISPEHRHIFESELNSVLPKYKKQYGLSYEISFSEQKESTDTIAVDLNNKPFHEDDESIVFRPGGHGALIENLNDLNAQIVFIKNIDNVVPDNLREPTYVYKKVIATHLLKLQKQAFKYLEMLDQASFTEEDLDAIIGFVKNDLMVPLDEGFFTLDKIEQVDFLFNKMNRPIRVCGMVKNEGEPGGGPFWVLSEEGESLQIVESSQIDMNKQTQKEIVESATHFNPVDLVCGLKDYQGKSFNLLDFVDPNTGFISLKSKDGRKLKAQELPGLWNGAMADWISLFVEVPLETFNPVKIVNDLIRPQHQA